jgi:replicative DNA helicase
MIAQENRLDLARLMLDVFKGREDVVAIPGEPTQDGKETFKPYRLSKPMPAHWISDRHLAGKACLGVYTTDKLSRCWFSAVDFDNHPDHPDPLWQDKATKVFLWLQQAGLEPLAEVSQRGSGAHVWLFFDEPAPAWIVRAWWRGTLEKSGVPPVEIYPKQDELEEGKIGNLIRYPLWNQSRFCDPENDWSTLDASQALKAIKRTNAAELKALAFSLGIELTRSAVPSVPTKVDTGASSPVLSLRVQDRLGRQSSLLARRWGGDMTGLKDQSRSALLLSIACELVRQYVPTPEIADAVRYWGCEQGMAEKVNRADWMSLTMSKAYEFVLLRTEEKSAAATNLHDACMSYLDTLERGEQLRFSSGVGMLDDSIEGVAPGEMCVIAARPSNGKTAFGCQWARNMAGCNVPCLIISEEMSAIMLGKRALQSFSNQSEQYWGRDTVPMLRNDVTRYFTGKAPIFIVENCNSIDRTEKVIEQFVGLHGVRFVVVDYLQLLKSKGNSRYEEVSDISMRLKQAAGRHDLAMLAMAQLNREVEKRKGNEPQLSDLRDAGQIEQDADIVLFLQHPYRMNQKAWEHDPTLFRVWCKKHRNGAIRHPFMEISFDLERQLFGVYRMPGSNGTNGHQGGHAPSQAAIDRMFKVTREPGCEDDDDPLA